MITEMEEPTQYHENQVQIFKALTHPTRLAILEMLRDGEHCVCHMEAFLGVRQAALSQQLSILRDAKLIQDRRDGWNIFYRVADPRIFSIIDASQKMLGERDSSLQKTNIQCPCPACNPAHKQAE
jgi:ArsR family transcriptional regulator